MRLALEKLDAQTHGDMERDVAVHEPCSWVVGWVGNDKPSASRQECYITARRVRELKLGEMCAHRELSSTSTENVHVMTVEMNWMGNWGSTRGLLNNPIGPLWKISRKHQYIMIMVLTWAVGDTSTRLYDAGMLLWLFSAMY